jgi:hypothetical protein
MTQKWCFFGGYKNWWENLEEKIIMTIHDLPRCLNHGKFKGEISTIEIMSKWTQKNYRTRIIPNPVFLLEKL